MSAKEVVDYLKLLTGKAFALNSGCECGEAAWAALYQKVARMAPAFEYGPHPIQEGNEKKKKKNHNRY